MAWSTTKISPATGFPQTAVKIHDATTGQQLGPNIYVDELVLDSFIEEGDRISYYAHNPFNNINRLDVYELDELTGNWTDVVNPHPFFESWRFTPAMLLNNGETVAYCSIDLDFVGVMEIQELRDGTTWTILSDEQHGDLLGHPCRDIQVNTEHTRMLINYQDNNGIDKMTMFGLMEDGSWV